MMGSFVRIAAGFLAGAFFDIMKNLSHNSDYGYRFNFVWSTVFTSLMAAVSFIAYRKWHQLGGDAHYHPPAPWSEKKIEEMPIVTTIGPQTGWLNVSFRIFDAIMALSVLGLFPLMWWMYEHRLMTAFYWYAVAIMPLSMATWLYWFRIKRGIRHDMRRCGSGQPLVSGIPHHGVMMVAGVKFLLLLALWVFQVAVAVNLKMETGAIVFGIGNVITNLMLALSIWALARLERAILPCLDTRLAVSAEDAVMEGTAEGTSCPSAVVCPN